MAVEARRGCGFRRVGGLYVVGGGLSAPCDRMPFPLDRCKTCGGGIKFTRGPQWLQPDFFEPHYMPERNTKCLDESPCPVCVNGGSDESPSASPDDLFGPHLLLWIGRGHYTPEAYLKESHELGVSRRLSAMPKGLVLGETWVLLAHLDAVPPVIGEDGKSICGKCGEDRSDHVPRPSGNIWCPAGEDGRRPESNYEPAGGSPGIFCAFVPRAVELILKQSDATPDRVEKEAKRGVTVVAVPDDDPDHQGSVWDSKDDAEQLTMPVAS